MTIHQEIFNLAADFYHSQVTAPAAQTYLAARGHTPELVDKMKLGFTGSRNSLLKYFVDTPWTVPDTGDVSTLYKSAKADLLASGLIREKEGKLADYFPPNCIVFPLLERGQVNHFRFKDPEKKIKYQLPFEFKLNGQLFYNQDDLRHKRLILVEGENDVLTVRRVADAERLNVGVIGVLGTFSEEQQKALLDQRETEIFLMFDNDEAGRKYAERFIQAAVGLDVFVVTYGSAGNDPDDYFRVPGASNLAPLLRDADDGICWYIDQLPDADSALKAKKFVKPAIELVAKVKNKMALEMYVDDAIRKKYPSLKRPAVVELLQQAGAELGTKVQNFEVYDASSQIFVSENSYWISGKDGAHRMVSNFVLAIRNIFRYEDAQTGESWLKYECVMVNYGNVRSQPVMFEPGDRVNTLKFMEKCAGQGEFRFWGNAQNLSHIWSLVENDYESKNIVNLIQRYGYLENHDLWLMENCAVKAGKIYPRKDNFLDVAGTGFKSENVLVYGGDRPGFNVDLELTPELLERVIENYWVMCDGKKGFGSEFKGLLAMGFLAAAVYRSEIMNLNGSFPELFFYGPSGTGKTTAAQLLFRMFGFVNPPETWESATVASMSQMMSQLSHLPMFLDEFRNIGNRQQDMKISLLRNAWNGAGAGKGGTSGIRQIFKILSVIMIAGEDLPTDKGCLSRFIVIRFDALNPIRNTSYNWLMQNREVLSAVFLHLILQKNRESTEALPGKLKKYDDLLLEKGVLDERTRKNYSAILAGFESYKYKENDFLFYEKFVEFVVAEAMEDISRKQQEDVLQKFFEHVVRLMPRQPFCYSVRIIDGEELAISFNDFYHELKKELRQAGDDLDSFKKTTLLEYIVKSPFFIKQENGRRDKAVRFESDQAPKRAICINISKLPLTIRELFDDLEIPEKAADF